MKRFKAAFPVAIVLLATVSTSRPAAAVRVLTPEGKPVSTWNWCKRKR